MTTAADAKSEFLAHVKAALNGGTFVKLSLGKVRSGNDLRGAVASLVLIKQQPRVRLVTSHVRKDDTKNFTFSDFIAHIAPLFGETFKSATLLGAELDVTIDYSRKGEPRLTARKNKRAVAAPAEHDRLKAHVVAPDRPYLKALGVSDAEGRVKPSMQGKYKQINRFVEIVASLFKEAGRASGEPLSIVDIGSGKGYLTFALYDYLTGLSKTRCRFTGVEVRDDLVKSCGHLANELGFDGLSFVRAEASSINQQADVVIALHACDTATDDAMAFGVAAKAKLIVTAPCCQHELAPQLKGGSSTLDGLMKYPLLRQRQADLVTDAARALLLEASGYKVKIIEFVSTEHTSKNILIAATRSSGVEREAALRQYHELKALAGFETQHLATRLNLAGV